MQKDFAKQETVEFAEMPMKTPKKIKH